jgi:hypothetical protein
MYYGIGQLWLTFNEEPKQICCEQASFSTSLETSFKFKRTKYDKVSQLTKISRTSVSHVLTLTFGASSNALINLMSGGIASTETNANELIYTTGLNGELIATFQEGNFDNIVKNDTIDQLDFEGVFCHVNQDEKLFVQTKLLTLQSSPIAIDNFSIDFLCLNPKIYKLS